MFPSVPAPGDNRGVIAWLDQESWVRTSIVTINIKRIQNIYVRIVILLFHCKSIHTCNYGSERFYVF
ncbi:hypothetical protein MBAV_003648 [Candidatus Magnetobacterium bavaricum]|uniref:Uncharacterized protein n=1 Tax=Candidatus Magnetobacterium bavaricum TaxID=29290 RepID=A0A0F3GQP3_9BACT|nr:hypothetical protein MBAV_003648 [Candidatus Magnetobacterium bavaricum]